MQTCLEKVGLSKRPIELNRNDYRDYNEYSVTHKNAISDGDPKGKGTGHGGHTHYIPDCSKAIMTDYGHMNSPIDYSNFDTDNGGGSYDIKGRESISHSGRERLTSINMYSNLTQYSASLVNTEANVNDGQVIIR